MSIFSREVHAEHNPRVYFTLVGRHFKVFFKNKVNVLFSFLVPLITLFLYIIFLRQLQVTAINTNLKDIAEEMVRESHGAIEDWKWLYEDSKIMTQATLLADAWMFSGIISVSCVSVSLNTSTQMIIDKMSGVSKDFISSPISRRSINASYLIYNVLASFLINMVVLIIAYIYLGCTGGFLIDFGSTLLLIPVILLCVLSASLITCFVASFITNYNTYNGISVITSSATGFFIGAFMPISFLPGVAKRIPLFFPGTYATGLIRNLVMKNYYLNLENYIAINHSEQLPLIRDKIHGIISIDIDFFGYNVTPGFMVLVIAIFAVIFILLNLMFQDYNLRSSLQGRMRRHKKK